MTNATVMQQALTSAGFKGTRTSTSTRKSWPRKRRGAIGTRIALDRETSNLWFRVIANQCGRPN